MTFFSHGDLDLMSPDWTWNCLNGSSDLFFMGFRSICFTVPMSLRKFRSEHFFLKQLIGMKFLIKFVCSIGYHHFTVFVSVVVVFVFLISFFLFEEYKIWFYTESSKVLVLHLLTGWLRTNNTIFVFQLLLTNQVVGICQTFMRMTDVGHTVIS